MKARRIAVTLAACALATSSFGTASAQRGGGDTPEQWRSYWVDAFNEGIYNPAQVGDLVDDALDINANAMIVQVVRRYDCFCNRAMYPRTDAEGLDPAPYDPLDQLIEQAHAAGLEVHAWVNVATMWNSATPPTQPDHVFNQHGPSAEGAERWLNKRADGTELVGANAFIDLGHPAAVDYIVDGIGGIVREYDIDGINLDYIRYPDYSSAEGQNDWGYNDVSLARFQAATGRTDVPAPTDPQWADWRRAQVTNLVRRIYLEMWDADPQARLSMDAITYAYGPQSMGGWEKTRPYTEVLQDWKRWQDGGFMDTVVAMNYKRNWMPDQAQMYSEWTAVLADWQGDRQSVNGPALYLNSISDSISQAAEALTPTAAGNMMAGWSGYSYANPSMDVVDGPPDVRDAEREVLADAFTEGDDALFADDADVPSMPWKESPTDGHIAGDITLKDGTPLDQVDSTLIPLFAGGERATTRTDGSGRLGFVHVEPGRYLVKIDLPDGVVGRPLTTVTVEAGDIVDADITDLFPVPRR